MHSVFFFQYSSNTQCEEHAIFIASAQTLLSVSFDFSPPTERQAAFHRRPSDAALMQSIRAGFELRKTDARKRDPAQCRSAPVQDGMAQALAKALANRSLAIHSDQENGDSGDDDEDSDDTDWC